MLRNTNFTSFSWRYGSIKLIPIMSAAVDLVEEQRTVQNPDFARIPQQVTTRVTEVHFNHRNCWN